MPVARGEGAVERLVEVVDRGGRQQAVEALPATRAVVRLRNVGSSASVSAARLDGARVGIGEARVVQQAPSRPIALTSASQNFSVMHMTKIQPSAVGKVCTGASDRCALRGTRGETSPSFRYQTPG